VTGVLAASAPAGSIGAPHIEYGQLAPMLVVFGAAIIGGQLIWSWFRS